jgi:hypothetical protein
LPFLAHIGNLTSLEKDKADGRTSIMAPVRTCVVAAQELVDRHHHPYPAEPQSIRPRAQELVEQHFACCKDGQEISMGCGKTVASVQGPDRQHTNKVGKKLQGTKQET